MFSLSKRTLGFATLAIGLGLGIGTVQAQTKRFSGDGYPSAGQSKIHSVGLKGGETIEYHITVPVDAKPGIARLTGGFTSSRGRSSKTTGTGRCGSNAAWPTKCPAMGRSTR